jgi:hypothetical protein
MFEVQTGPVPEGTKTRSVYNFNQMEVGNWFFAPGKRPATVRAAATSYRLSKDKMDVRFSCVAARIDNQNGTLCKRVA